MALLLLQWYVNTCGGYSVPSTQKNLEQSVALDEILSYQIQTSFQFKIWKIFLLSMMTEWARVFLPHYLKFKSRETLLLSFTLTALLASNIVARPNSFKLFSYECKLAKREPQQN